MEEKKSEKSINQVLVVSLCPYFLEKPNFWFEENLKKILKNQQTRSFFQDNVLFLEKGKNLNLSEILRKLDEMGYEKVYKVSEIGEFSHYGGIIEIFPINSNYAARLDFLGNQLETIERLDILIENEKKAKKILKNKLKSQKFFSDLKGLKINEYLVHLDHGIGKFIGFSEEKKENLKYYILEYAQQDKLYVPLGLERKLSRYIGFTEPKISRLGSSVWQKTKKRIKEGAEKLAKELLEIYAKREITIRNPYVSNDEIQKQISSTFEYEETPDQLQALEEINQDLEKNQPMDRLVCGDVGFGKTEIALRTAVKAVCSGVQTALLCPTTILAEQHFQNFRKRIDGLPIKIARLSRLESKKNQEKTIKDLKNGLIDIIIGTHRILSKDIEFKNLGLLIIDDEQKFGVKQKETLKKIRAGLDVLSLSATPIPRTLYLGLSNFKSISLIYTPPPGRLAIKTFIFPWSEKIIKESAEKEIIRGGQVYYLYNRIDNIETVKKFLENLIPKAKAETIHGRMREKNLIKIMEDFRNKKFNILIATTIIENGLDLSNVNTLIVADATRLGLSQAYQLRGRIGRGRIQSFAFFLHGKKLSDLAKIRLKALKEAEEPGSGYRVALKDLEIRGAGNILGKEQSGNVNKVGLNLYCQMLNEAVEKLKNN
jgi:transcription-repair coupling factor (superfamily II helicase)